MNSNISERQILQFILKINEEIDNLKFEVGKMRGDIRILYNLCENAPKGEPGPPGKTGEPGTIGAQGPPGEIRGEKGIKGPSGPMGDRCDKGDKGEIGLPGIHGDKGEPWEKGFQGEPGIPGISGIQGDKGQSGNIKPGPTFYNYAEILAKIDAKREKISQYLMFKKREDGKQP